MPEPNPPVPAAARKFFVVWSPQGGPPMVRLPKLDAARSAALRLAAKHPGQDFFVLASCWSKLADSPTGEGTVAPDSPIPGSQDPTS